jgi:hypothetical protein
MTNLEDITMHPSRADMLNYQVRQIVARSLMIPGARQGLRFAKKVVTHLENVDRAYQLTRQYSEFAGKGAEAVAFDSGFGYSSEYDELGNAEHYRKQLLEGSWDTQKTESHQLYASVIPMLESCICQADIKEVLDFGVSYGYVDGQLAEKLTNTHFYGIDRSVLTKVYNERFFNLPNLSFVAGNIFDYMGSKSWDNALCFHMRTLVCLPEACVREFYEKCAKAGFKYIVGAEQCGISWQTGKPYAFSTSDQPSVAFRNYMYIHNYPGLLKNVGYTVKKANLLKTRHPDPNFRILLFIAEL